MFWTPKWKKETELLLKGAQKFLHYKRDLLKADRIDEIESRIADLKMALKSSKREAVEECSRQLRATCEKALPHQAPVHWFPENVEVIFVALVVALGLRSYVIQPFRIPTGSMQPTLNGIIATNAASPDQATPWIGKQALDWALRARRWQTIESPTHGRIVAREDVSKLFFSRTRVVFHNGAAVIFPAPMNETDQAINGGVAGASCVGKSFEKGEVMFRGTIDGGDMVLVDKFSYHFRRPTRGEVFVFDTLGMERKIGRFTGSDQAKATHYIKRLCGVPGDTIAIESPQLLVNGKIATEKGIRRVFELPNTGQSGGYGYSYGHYPGELLQPGDSLSLTAQAPRGMREYAALGDNSGNSLDSRYWGSVKEFNLVGPALFSLWPFTTGHWGLIK
jgi:signal peptidase I